MTANDAVGPVALVGENVTIPEQSELVAVKAPVYPASVAMNDSVYPVALKFVDDELKLTADDGVGDGTGVGDGDGVGDGLGVGVAPTAVGVGTGDGVGDGVGTEAGLGVLPVARLGAVVGTIVGAVVAGALNVANGVLCEPQATIDEATIPAASALKSGGASVLEVRL